MLRPFNLLAWVAPLPLVSAASWIMSRPPAGVSYDLWAWASAALHDSLALSGPLLLVWSSLLAARATGRHWVFSSIPANIRVRQHMRMVILTTSLGLLAHAVGLVPRMLFATSTATYGGFYVASAMMAAAWILIFCAVGTVCGYAISRARWLVPLPFVVAILLFMPPIYNRAWAVLLPNKQWRPDVQTQPSLTVTIMTTALAAMVLALTFLIVDRSSSPAFKLGPIDLPFVNGGELVAAGAVAGLFLASFAFRPEIYVPAPLAEPVCRDTVKINICLHPAHIKSFPEVATTLASLKSVGLESYVPRVVDTSLDPSGVTVPGSKLLVSIDSGKDSTYLTRGAVYELLLGSCPDPTGTISDNDTSPPTIAFALVGATLNALGIPENGPPLGDVGARFSQLSTSQVISLLQRTQGAVKTCSLHLSDLP